MTPRIIALGAFVLGWILRGVYEAYREYKFWN